MVFAPPGPLRQKLPQFDSQPSAGQTCQLRVPTGPTYDKINLILTDGAGGRTAAEIASDISRIVLRVGTDVKWDLTGAQLVYHMDYWVANSVSPNNNGVLPLYFARPWMQPVAGNQQAGTAEPFFSNIDGPAYGMQGQSNFLIEITFDAGSGTTGIEAWSSQRAGTPLGQHATLLPHRRNLAGAGTDEVQDIKLSPERSIVSMHIGDSTVSEVEIRADDTTIYRQVPSVAEAELREAGRTPSSNYYAIAFDQRNRFRDALPETMTDLRVKPTFGTGPGDYTIIIERIETAVVEQVQRAGR